MATKSKMQTLIDALDNYPRIIVFTQNLEFIKQFLFDEKGKWTLSINRNLWPTIDHPKLEINSINKKCKVNIVNTAPEVGLDVEASRIVFTKNLWFPLKPSDYIIKHEMKMPIVVKTPFIGEIVGQTFVKCETKQAVHYLHDYLEEKNIEHSIFEEPFKAIHLNHFLQYSEEHKTLIHNGIDYPQNFMAWHTYDFVYILYDDDVMDFRMQDMLEIQNIFMEDISMALHPEYVSFRIGMPISKCEKALNFMVYAGTVKRAVDDYGSISIEKKGKNDDPIFDYIPNGISSMRELIKHLKIRKEDLLPLLKKLNIDYYILPKSQKTFYFLKENLSVKKFNTTLQWMQKTCSIILDLISIQDWINKELDYKIEKHCKQHNTEAVLFKGNNSTKINFGEFIY